MFASKRARSQLSLAPHSGHERQVDSRRHPRPGRPAGGGDRGQQRARLVTALELARARRRGGRGRRRSTDKGEAAAGEIAKETGGAKPRVLGARPRQPRLDPRVRRPSSRASSIDLLINNAGDDDDPAAVDQRRVRAPVRHQPPGPLRAHRPAAGRRAALGRRPHRAPSAATSTRAGKLDFDDLQKERSYSPRGAYQGSKLANAVFAVELDRTAARRRLARRSACSPTPATRRPTCRAPGRPGSPRRR